MQESLYLLGSGHGVDMHEDGDPICYLLRTKTIECRDYYCQGLFAIPMLVQVQDGHFYCQILAAEQGAD